MSSSVERVSAPAASGFARFRAGLNPADRRSSTGMYGFIVLLHVIGPGY